MTTPDYLSMSDEEWLNAAVPTAEEQSTETVDENPTVDNTQEAEDQTTSADAPAAEGATDPEPTGEGEGGPAGKGAEGGEKTQEAPGTEASEGDAETIESGTADKAAEIDYKAAYEKLTKPFKANGREIQITDVEDAVTLMQMGANYNKKMAALKPNLKLMKLLENNGLLSEEKIGYLIDLQAKNPAAISKLIKESGVDPLELDESKAGDYRPTQRVVDDRELALDQVLGEIQESPQYARTLNVVSNEWDGSSKQIIANEPQLLKVLNSHMESGIYDLITAEVERERVFGRLSNLSDLEAYRKAGDAIQARGGFDHIGRDKAPTPPKAVPQVAKPSEEQVQKVKDRKRSASPTAAVAPQTNEAPFNPLALSDDEFSKLVKTKYL